MENLIVIWQIAQHKMYNQYHLVTLLYMVHHCSTSCGLSICIIDKPNIILFLLRLNLSWTGKWIRFRLWLSGESVRFFWSASYIRVFQEVTSSGTKWQKRVSCTTGSLCDTGLKTALSNTTNHRAPHLNSLFLTLLCTHCKSTCISPMRMSITRGILRLSVCICLILLLTDTNDVLERLVNTWTSPHILPGKFSIIRLSWVTHVSWYT